MINNNLKLYLLMKTTYVKCFNIGIGRHSSKYCLTVVTCKYLFCKQNIKKFTTVQIIKMFLNYRLLSGKVIVAKKVSKCTSTER